MYQIVKKKQILENINEYVIKAEKIAKKALAGQFVILIVDEKGERVPFTICDYDRKEGTITLLVQTVGASTMKLAMLKDGDYIKDLVGPLGNATDLEGAKNVLLVGGGIGAAVISPQAKALNEQKIDCDAIVGGRSKDFIMYEDKFNKYCNNVYICTDDGSYGTKGFVTDKLKDLILSGKKYDVVFAVGPLMMMRAVCNVTKEFGIKTVVSMNSLMVDGTGMCGCCRVTVGNEIKYACVHGPEFDGHLVDFDEAINRSKSYIEQEKEHVCRLTGVKN